jgi:hypothetical protein
MKGNYTSGSIGPFQLQALQYYFRDLARIFREFSQIMIVLEKVFDGKTSSKKAEYASRQFWSQRVRLWTPDNQENAILNEGE